MRKCSQIEKQKQINQLQTLFANMIEGLKEVILAIDPNSSLNQIHHLDPLVEILSDLAVLKSKMAVNYIGLFIDVINANYLTVPKKYWYLLTDQAITIMELKPSLLSKNMAKVERMLDLLVLLMANVDQQVSDFWFNPPEGANFDDLEYLENNDIDAALISNLRSYVDRILSCFGYDKCLNLFLAKIQKCLQESDWRWRAAGLMTASQFSQCQFDFKIKGLVELFFQCCSDPHPVVRYSAAHAIGQFSEDFKPDFQSEYSESYLHAFLNGSSDPINTVACHWIASFTNFFEDCSNKFYLQPHLNQLIQKFDSLIQNGNSTSKENSVSAIATLCTISGLFDSQTVLMPLKICKQIYEKYDGSGLYKQLLNQTIECHSILIVENAELINSDKVQEFFMVLDQIAEQLDADYFFSAFLRLCNKNLIMLNWLPLLHRLFEKINESQYSSFQTALHCISAASFRFKDKFNSMAMSTVKKIGDKMAEKELDDTQNEFTTLCIQTMSQIIVESGPIHPSEDWDLLVKNFIQFLFKKLELHHGRQNFEVAADIYSSLPKVMSQYCYLMNENDSRIGLEKFMGRISELISQRTIFKDNLSKEYEESMDEMDLQIENNENNQKIKSINKCLFELPKLLLFFIQKIPSNSINLWIGNLIELAKNSILQCQIDTIQLGLEILKTILQEINFDQEFPFQIYLCEPLLENMTHCRSRIRSVALEGISTFIMKIPLQEIPQQIVEDVIEKVKKAYLMNEGSDSQKQYQSCQQDCVALMGAIIKTFGTRNNAMSYFGDWVKCLKFKHQKQKEKEQIEILILIIESYGTNIFPPNPLFSLNLLIDIVNILLSSFTKFNQKIMAKKRIIPFQNSEQFLKKAKSCLSTFMHWDFFQQNQAQIKQKLGVHNYSILESMGI